PAGGGERRKVAALRRRSARFTRTSWVRRNVARVHPKSLTPIPEDLAMIRRLALAILALVALAPRASRADDLAFPDTAPGRHARAWFTAYAADEAAMRAFFQAHGDSAALVMRPIDARLDVWREMRKALGAITPVCVLDSGPAFTEVAA